MATIISEKQLELFILRNVKEALRRTGKELREVLEEKIYDEWYSRSGVGGGDSTNAYDRTWQLPRAVDSELVGNNGVKVFINPDKLRPMQHKDPNKFHSYMSLDYSTTYGDKSISEWVIEWIEKGNSWRWMKGQDVHMLAEAEIRNKRLDDLIMVEKLNELGIEAKAI